MPDQITTKPFVSQAQAGWAFATEQPFARRWARQTGPYKKLPKRVKRKAVKTKAYTYKATYTRDEFYAYALKAGTSWDIDVAAEMARRCPELATFKGEQIAPGITRIHGNLCNVHGRYGRCPGAAVAPKKRTGLRKGRAAAKPKLTEAQKRQAQEAKRQGRAQQHAAEQEQHRADTLRKLGIAPDGQQALEALRRGEQPDAAAIARGGFVKAGLVEQADDGSYRMTPSGRALLGAADAGDAGRAGDTISGARDRTTARTTRQEAAAKRRANAEAKRAAAAGKKPKAGSSTAKPKQPAPRQPRIPRAAGSRRPSASVGGGSGSTAAPAPATPKLPQPLRDAVQALSDGRTIDDQTRDLLVRNGLARIVKGELVLTAAGQRAIKTKDYTPTRTTDAGHTGVMVALFPDAAAAKAIASAKGVTEPVGQLHLTLCFLGDSTEQPLATNKEKVIAAMQDWAQQHGQPLKGTINGLGRFFHSESDDTNAVYVSPDVPGLPELRQSLAEAIEASGFDYSHDHGFTPHITVAYVPLDAPTPPIRIETPVQFDHVTLAWGDEHYDFPLGIATKAFTVFKDATGAYRWLARTTTAFEDRDEEVISTKALADSADSDLPRGPLRFWHMGRPNPHDAARPWGPGVDLGWCDFAALSGRTLIESGTFKSEPIARAIAAKADQLELSPGFFHAAGEPDASGVFDHIRIFERSLVPTWAGRASNPYTGLVVEKTMDQKKVDALKTLGIPETTIKELLGEVAQVEKTAEADGARYKAAAPEPTFIERLKAFLGSDQTEAEAVPEAEPATPESAAVNELASGVDLLRSLEAEYKAFGDKLAALKASLPPAPAEEAKANEDMLVEEEPATDDMAEDDAGGLTLSAEDLTAIGQVAGAAVASALEPLVGALGIVQKLEGGLGELKTAMSGYTKTKDDADAQRAEEVATLKTKLAELLDDQPRGGYRPSQASDNTLAQVLAAAVAKEASANGKPAPTPEDPFADLAYELLPGARV